MSEYLDILNAWERRVANPFIFENLSALLPAWGFTRKQPGTSRDRWVSRLKIDLSEPKKPNPEKTVVSALDLKMREQGDWDNGIWIMDILMKELGLENTFQVYSYLSDRYSLDMPHPDSASVKAAMKRNQRRRDLLDLLREYFAWCLFNSKTEKAGKARSYLRSQRGFKDEDMHNLSFGFVPQWSSVVTYAGKNGYSAEDVEAVCNVCNDEGYTAVGRSHVLAIPYVCSGALKGFLFRRVDGDESPKYIANAGLDRKSEFFNYPEEGSRVIAVVEGELDALTATAAGIPGVVAMGGSEISGDRRRQVEKAFTHGTRQIILCPDLDTVPGSDGIPNHAKRYNAVMKSVHTIKDVDFDFDGIFVMEFPEPSDPDSFIREHGSETFLQLMRAAKPWWEYAASCHRDGLLKA